MKTNEEKWFREIDGKMKKIKEVQKTTEPLELNFVLEHCGDSVDIIDGSNFEENENIAREFFDEMCKNPEYVELLKKINS